MKRADMDQNFEKLKGLIGKIRVAMLTTIDNGELRSRPMATTEIAEDGVLWFFTYADSPKTEEISHDGHVNISYADTEKELYVSVSGSAATIRDRNKIDELWNPMYAAWFKNGKDDPNIALLRVEPHLAEFWESPSGLKKQYEMLKSALTNASYDEGDHQKLKF
jgi:general stress protein 26